MNELKYDPEKSVSEIEGQRGQVHILLMWTFTSCYLSVCTFTENSARQLNCPFLPALSGIWPCKVIKPEGYRGQFAFWFTLTWPLAYRPSMENSSCQLKWPFLPAFNGVRPGKVPKREGYRVQFTFSFTCTCGNLGLRLSVPPGKTAVDNWSKWPFLPACNGIWPGKVPKREGYRVQFTFPFTCTCGNLGLRLSVPQHEFPFTFICAYFPLPLPVNLVLTIWLAKVITKSESTPCRVKTIGWFCYLLGYSLQNETKKERRFKIFWRQNLVSLLVRHAILPAFCSTRWENYPG